MVKKVGGGACQSTLKKKLVRTVKLPCAEPALFRKSSRRGGIPAPVNSAPCRAQKEKAKLHLCSSALILGPHHNSPKAVGRRTFSNNLTQSIPICQIFPGTSTGTLSRKAVSSCRQPSHLQPGGMSRPWRPVIQVFGFGPCATGRRRLKIVPWGTGRC